MSNKKIILSTGAIILSAGIISSVAIAANVDLNANATVLTPLTIQQTGGIELDFGDIGGDGVGNTTVVLLPSGTTSSPDGASVGGAPAAGSFDVTGAASSSYSIQYQDPVLLSGGGDTLTVGTFTSSAGAGNLGLGGAQTVTVGATATIKSTQVAATYTGTYNVTVNYP